ncbi:hypothetical protein ABEV54_15290 [Peribacillus psychrosaccharolyticus]|uniref:hypothetical protein n=1 Tax=Peribacillus psychrosaccharolyticus TaxID=1407 RepID=UPI003D2AC3D8
MLNKKKAIQVLTVTAAVTGVAAVAQPINVDAASSAKNSVTKAEKLAAQLKKDINYDARKKANPKTAVGLPNEKLYKQTKTAYNKALAEAKKVNNSKERKVLETRLAQKVKPFIDRTDKYRAAVQMGIKLNTASKVLNERVQANNLNETTKKQYDLVSSDLKKLDKQIKSVYGKTTRPALTKAYSDKASTIVSTAKFALNFKSDTDNLVKSVKNEDYAKAVTYITSLKKLISDNKKYNYVSTSSKLYKKLYAAYSPSLAKLNALGKIYIATSKSAANPTISGGKTPTQALTYTKDVTVIAGENRYIKLRNANIKGNLNIMGINKGAGTVTLENVKVSSLKNKGGQIIVKDVAEKSLHLTNITANDLIVNDANGSNIVAGAGAKIANLLVSDKAGGNVNLQSSNGNAFGIINLKSKNSKAINFAGKFDKSNVVVSGNEQKLNFAAGTVINELTLKAGANITAAEGVKIAKLNIDPAKKGEIITLSGDLKDTVVTIKDANAIIKIAENTVVGEIKVDPSVKGEVSIENKGTINKIDESIEIIGNPVTPGVPAEPTPPGGGGGGVGGGDQTPPETLPAELLKVTANVGGEVEMKDNVIDLTGKNDDQMFTEIKITTKNATKFILNNVNVRGENVDSYVKKLQLDVKKDVITIPISKLLGNYDVGNNGISMANLRAIALDKPVILEGFLSNGSVSDESKSNTKITIKLGIGSNLPTVYDNKYVTIVKKGVIEGQHTVSVKIKDETVTLGDVDSISGGTYSIITLIKSYTGLTLDTEMTLGELKTLITKFKFDEYNIIFE